MEQEEILNELQTNWGLQVAHTTISAEEVIRLLSFRIGLMMDKNPEQFFQLMYRLDISEKKLALILNQPDAAEQVATLVYERQAQKVKSRTDYKQQQAPDEDLKW